MERHHPAWTAHCLDNIPASWAVPEAWAGAWVSRSFEGFFFSYWLGFSLIHSLEREEVLPTLLKIWRDLHQWNFTAEHIFVQLILSWRQELAFQYS